MSTWVQNKRKLLSLSQTEVANSLGISRPTYLKLERGVAKLTEQQKAILASLFEVSHDTVDKNSEDKKVNTDTIYVREIPKENIEKFKQVLLYIVGKVGSRPNIGQTAIYKLLYFIDFDYYEKYEEPLMGATYIRNTYGPTPISFVKIVKELESEGRLVVVKSKYFDRDQTKYLPVVEADVSGFKGQELNHIDNELERLSHFTARQLSELSHKDTPWRVAKNKEVINYEHVFYRPEETSVREYEPL
ncbi:MAG: type II toxin-antitoxin system antitoxin SocA domain-containing protein [Patescibacteria group bacterium]